MTRKKKALVTGGCGFIGSNFIHFYLNQCLGNVVNLDKQTYAGQGKNLEHRGLSDDKRLRTVTGDICDPGLVDRVFDEEKPDYVFHFAAESHVDRSIQDPSVFVRTNVLGTQVLLDAALKHGIETFVQISTDEVYGSLNSWHDPSKETDTLKPRSPYAASKAAAEHLALAAFHTHGLPVVVTRSANNYGPYQFPEKLIPLFITNLFDGKKVPLMWSPQNPGLNKRDWIHVQDNCRAIWFVAKQGNPGEVYNIPGENEKSNIRLTEFLLECFGLGKDMIKHVKHRKGHDLRYAISGDKLRELGYDSFDHVPLDKGLPETIDWYERHEDWWRPLKK